MGNIQSISSKDIADTLRITDSFLQNFHTHATIVDHSVAALARAIDAMVSSCTRDFNKQEGAPQSGEKLLMSVLKATQDCIGDLKVVVTESVNNLLCFIIEECFGHSKNVGEMCSSLSVHKYLQHITEKGDGDDVVHLCKRSFNELKTECSLLRETLSLKSDTINNLVKREALYVKEIELCNEKLDRLETRLSAEQPLTPRLDINIEYKAVEDKSAYQETMNLNENVSGRKSSDNTLFNSINNTATDSTSNRETYEVTEAHSIVLKTPKQDNDILGSDYESIKAENEALRQKIDNMERQQTVRVQLYKSNTFLSSSLQKVLIDRLREKLDDRRIELKDDNVVTVAAVNPSNLLLICYDYNANHVGSAKTICRAVKPFQVSSKTAVLLFHRTDDAGFSLQVEQFCHDNQSLGAVFHAGYTSVQFQQIVLNERVVDGIVDFVISQGDVKPKYNTDD